MNETQFIEWLKDNHLFHIVHHNHELFKKVLTYNISVKRRNLLILGDIGYKGKRAPALMMGCYLLAAKRLGLAYKIVFQNPKKRNVPACESTIEAFSNLLPRSSIVLCLSGKLGSLKKLGKSFRKLIRLHNHKFLSTTGLEELPTNHFYDLIAAIDVDYPSMIKKADKLKRILDAGRIVRIITDIGTNLKIDIEGMAAISNTGYYPEFGGNIPAGEVYVPPRKNFVEGTLVIDGSCKLLNETLLVKHPVRIQIVEGKVKNITGGEEAKALKEAFLAAEQKAKYPWGIRRIGELGIGINPSSRISGPTIINEKTLGTAHIAIGSNAWFGGSVYAITHLDQVFKDPKIWVDGKRIIIK